MLSSPEYLEQIALNIREHRKHFKVSLPLLAKRAKISKGTLSKIENIKGNLTVETLWKIAKALDIPINDLLP